MIDTNIVDVLGAGSGLNSKRLVEQLTEIERAPRQEAIDTKRDKIDTQISDYGVMRNLLSTLQDSLDLISNPDTFSARGVAFPTTDVIVPTELLPGAASGSYEVTVQALAAAQSLVSGVYTEKTDPVGTGQMTISFGDWDDVVPPATPSLFTPNANRDPITINITDQNNTLEGLRDAINAEDAGVQANIINTGSGYQLVISAPSGEQNQLQISVDDDDTVDNDGNGLSAFAFETGNFQIEQKQVGQDAELTVNGLPISRASNNIDDVIDGLTFSLSKTTGLNEKVSFTITDDSGTAEQSIRDFVSTFNEFFEAVQPLTGLNEETQEFGGLYRDATAKSLMQQIRSAVGDQLAGINGGFDSLAAIGIRTQLDGSLQIDETTFRKAIDDNFDFVKDLFTPQVSSDSALIAVSGFNSSTVSGTYDVNITQAPTKGVFTGTAISFPLDTTGLDYAFTLEVDGVSGALSITQQNYATEQDLVDEIQAQATAAGLKVDVSIAAGSLVFESRSYGASSKVNILSDDGLNSIAGLGLSVASGVDGLNVAGTINGEAAFGLGNVLLPSLQSNAYGMKLVVNEAATGTSTISFGRGFSGTLFQKIDTFLANNGLIANRETNLEKNLERLDTEQERLDRRIEAFNARLLAQYTAMDAIVQNLNSTKDYLSGILANLPFTASRE